MATEKGGRKGREACREGERKEDTKAKLRRHAGRQAIQGGRQKGDR